jgi:hypothetical protein
MFIPQFLVKSGAVRLRAFDIATPECEAKRGHNTKRANEAFNEAFDNHVSPILANEVGQDIEHDKRGRGKNHDQA